jgi:hypothetical protein
MKAVIAVVALIGGAAALGAQTTPALTIETLKSVAAVPAHVLARISEVTDLAATPENDYLILDGRGHALYRVDRAGRTIRRFGQVGSEPGNLMQPSMLSMGPGDIFATLDGADGRQRIQYTATSGLHVGQVYLPTRRGAMSVAGDRLRTNASAIAFTGQTFLVNYPELGSPMVEMDTTGAVLRYIGHLRSGGVTGDPELELALNVGLPVVDPTGGYYFVFQTGVPAFRKYDRAGQLVYERHIEGREIDPLVQALPNSWTTRADGARPFSEPIISTAAADREGRLWIATRTSYTYVYERGEKTRTVLFQGARLIAPSSLFFMRSGRLLVGPDGYEFEVGR